MGRILSNKKEWSHDFGVKSLTRQTAINKTETTEHHQPCVPTWAARSRASFFPSGPQSPNLKQCHLTILFFRNTLRKPEPHPRRRDNGMQCWRGHRVTPPELASHFVCPLCLTLFFDTVVRVRHLDPKSCMTVWPQGCVHLRTNQ